MVPVVKILVDGIEAAEMSTEAATASGIALLESVISANFEAIIAKWLVARYDFDAAGIQDAMDDFRYYRDQMTGGKLFLDLSEVRKKYEEMCKCGHPKSVHQHRLPDTFPPRYYCLDCVCSNFVPVV